MHASLRGYRQAKGTKVVTKLCSVAVPSDQEKKPRKEQGTSLNDTNLNTAIESGTPRLR